MIRPKSRYLISNLPPSHNFRKKDENEMVAVLPQSNPNITSYLKIETRCLWVITKNYNSDSVVWSLTPIISGMISFPKIAHIISKNKIFPAHVNRFMVVGYTIKKA